MRIWRRLRVGWQAPRESVATFLLGFGAAWTALALWARRESRARDTSKREM